MGLTGTIELELNEGNCRCFDRCEEASGIAYIQFQAY
jgi:hypothetical protein